MVLALKTQLPSSCHLCRRSHNRKGWSIQGGELSVISMSQKVKWGYANSMAPSLPLMLKPYETFAMVMRIDAGEDMTSRLSV
eukprot:2572469-Ditylum_brightwellii.AAC.1